MQGLCLRPLSFVVRSSILCPVRPPPPRFHPQSRPIRLSNIPPAAFQRIAAFDGELPSDKDQGSGQLGRKRKPHQASSIVLDILKKDPNFAEITPPLSSTSSVPVTFLGRLEMASRVQINQVLNSSILIVQWFLARKPELDDFLRSSHGVDSEKAAVDAGEMANMPTATWVMCEMEVRFPKSKRVMDKLGITLTGSVDYSFDVVSAVLFAQAQARTAPGELVRSEDVHLSGSYPGKRSTCQVEGKTPAKFKRPASMRQAVAQAILVLLADSRRHTAVNILTCGSLWTFIVVTRAIGSQVPFKYRTTKAIHISRLDILRKLVFAAILAHPDDFEYILGRILAPAPAPSPATPRTPARASSKQSSVVPSLPDKFTSAAKPKKSAAARAKGGKGPGKK